MKTAYPVIFKKIEDGWYMASVPDLDINTQGCDIAEAIEMSRDAIGLKGIDLQDDGKEIPVPSAPEKIKCAPGEIISMVDIDLTEYRRANDLRTVRRNVTLPSWLNSAAEKAGVNVSSILQTALKEHLHLQSR